MIKKSVPNRDQRQHAPAEIWLAGHFPGQMSCDALDVFHQGDRLLEDIVVDALQNVTRHRPRLIKNGAIGVIDMAAAIRFSTAELAVDLKMPRHVPDVMFRIHRQSLSGYSPLRTSWLMPAITSGRSSRYVTPNQAERVGSTSTRFSRLPIKLFTTLGM